MKTDVQCEMSRRREGQKEGEKQAWKGQGSPVAAFEPRNSRRSAAPLLDPLQMCEGRRAIEFLIYFL